MLIRKFGNYTRKVKNIFSNPLLWFKMYNHKGAQSGILMLIL
jgi:hypothetical protein